MCAFVSDDTKTIDPYVKQIMVDAQQVIDVPVNREKRSGLNVGNILIAGGIGYVLFRTFLLEERVNDLTVLLKRQSMNGMRSDVHNATHREQHAANEYATSDDDDDDDESTHGTRRDDVDEEEVDEEEVDEVRFVEQPLEVPPRAETQTRQVAVETPPASAFVTTRQRHSGSELRRDSSRARPSTREA